MPTERASSVSWPYVASLTRTSSWPRPVDRRCRWPSMLATGLQSSARYPGSMLCWHLYTWMHCLNRIRSATSSQCKVWRRNCVRPLSYLRGSVTLTTREAALRTRCSYVCCLSSSGHQPVDRYSSRRGWRETRAPVWRWNHRRANVGSGVVVATGSRWAR